MVVPQLARYSIVRGGQLTRTSAEISDTFVRWVVRLERGHRHNEEKCTVDMDQACGLRIPRAKHRTACSPLPPGFFLFFSL